jgi:transcriptional regulator with XRE-family HTH domain
MKKSIHSAESELVTAILRRLRRERHMTQRQLADKLGREQSFVWRIEHGERRLDVLEFYWVCAALEADPSDVYNEICRGMMNRTGVYAVKPKKTLKKVAEPRRSTHWGRRKKSPS